MKCRLLIVMIAFSIFHVNAQNVGIGTTNPVYKLHIESASTNAMLLKTTSPIELSTIFFQHANIGVPVGFVGAAEGNMLLSANNLTTPGDIHFQTGGATQMIIKKSGQVGIGTINPGVRKLHVLDTGFVASRLAIFQTNANIADLEFWDKDGPAGHVGAWQGWMWINAFRSGSDVPKGILLHVQGTPRAYVNADGHLGIYNGNLYLHNSPTGIHLNGADRPIITRNFDAFSSGNYTGAGRWGLFMEPSSLTLGIPNVVGKGFEFAAYETNSTRNTVITIDRIGQLRRPGTSFSDLLPIALGNIRADGTSQGGSGNITSSKISNGLYNIVFSNFSYTDASCIVIATPIRQNSTDCFLQARQGLNGALNIYIRTDAGIPTDQAFHFVVYRN